MNTYLFVSFWATLGHESLSDSFMGNMEIKGDVPCGMADIVALEQHIKEELNFDVIDDPEEITAITITNWKVF